MKENKLLKKMFETERWEQLINKSELKGINKGELRALCSPEVRLRLYYAIVNGQYEIAVPHQALIPKDKPGEFRTVTICENVDRCVASLINDCCFELFPEMIHPSVKSYIRGDGCCKTALRVSREIVKIEKEHPNIEVIGRKYDFHDYFGSISIEAIDNLLDTIESKLGFEKETEPVMNVLRKFYHCNWVFNPDGELVQKYDGIKQGFSFASFCADAILYELDEFMSNKYSCYYRYSDDLIAIAYDTSETTDDILSIVTKYGVTLNPRKVEVLRRDTFFKFLGFMYKDDMITLSKGRVKSLQKEIEKRTINKKNISFEQARRNVIQYLYKGDGQFSWATSCLSVINCQADIDTINLFIMDCLRAVQTGKRKIGGLGVVTNLPDRTILRGTGKHVTANRLKTEKIIPRYLTIGCLSKNMKMGKEIYNACVRAL